MQAPQATQLKAQLRAATYDFLHRAKPLLRQHGRTTPEIIIRFDLKGRAAGQVVWRSGQMPHLRYNLTMALLQPEAFLTETVPHEVAHLVVGRCFPKARPHGSEWRSVMTFFGIDEAARCHHFRSAEKTVTRQRRWHYRCDCGDHQLSTTRHNRVQQFAVSYLCRSCGQPLQYQNSTVARDDREQTD